MKIRYVAKKKKKILNRLPRRVNLSYTLTVLRTACRVYRLKVAECCFAGIDRKSIPGFIPTPEEIK